MKFIRDLLGKKRKEATPSRPASLDKLEESYRDTIGALEKEQQVLQTGAPIKPGRPKSDTSLDVGTADKQARRTRMIDPQAAPAPAPAPAAEPEAPTAAAAPVNIWDLEDDAPSAELPPAAPAPTAPEAPAAPEPAQAEAAPAARSPARARRTKTRLIGFEHSDGAVVDLFNDAPKAQPTKSVKFPVGWIVIAEGPGRGESFSLLTGMSQIGRGDDQSVQLDFGDNSISRSNHAAVVFDPDSKEFLLGHGGKSNIVRLNGKPVISNEPLKNGDMIRIGDTTLKFIALCDKSFNWSDGGTEEDEDVAIA